MWTSGGSCRRLAELQYTRNEMELRRATYRVKGDVIDIFPAESDKEAIRVELFDDEIEQITLFDPSNRPRDSKGASNHHFP